MVLSSHRRGLGLAGGLRLRWPFGEFGVILVGMGTVHQLTGRRPGDERAFRASIAVGIGDDDTVGTLTVSEHGSEADARAWLEAELPRARFPDRVARRRHGTAGAFLFGQIERGFYVEDAAEGVAFEPDLDQPGWDAGLVDGTLRWRRGP